MGSPGSAGLSKADLRTSPACFGAHLLQWPGKEKSANEFFRASKSWLRVRPAVACQGGPLQEGRGSPTARCSTPGSAPWRSTSGFCLFVDCLTASTLMTVPSARRRCSKTSQSSETELRKVASSWARISPLPGRERKNI